MACLGEAARKLAIVWLPLGRFTLGRCHLSCRALLFVLIWGVLLRSEAESVSLQQDVSKGWLVLRFIAANNDLVGYSGVIGACHLPSEVGHLHAQALKQATEKILEEMAVPTSRMPRRSQKRTALREGFKKFLPRLFGKIEMIAADGAADEQLTLQLLFGGRLRGLLFQYKDLAHAMRRVANRTTFADPYLKKVFLN